MLNLRAVRFQVQVPGAYIWRVFCVTSLGGYNFPNFTVSLLRRVILTTYLMQPIFKQEYSLNFFIKLLLGVLIEEG